MVTQVNTCSILVMKPEGREALGKAGRRRRVILKWIQINRLEGRELGWAGLGYQQDAWSCESRSYKMRVIY